MRKTRILLSIKRSETASVLHARQPARMNDLSARQAGINQLILSWDCWQQCNEIWMRNAWDAIYQTVSSAAAVLRCISTLDVKSKHWLTAVMYADSGHDKRICLCTTTDMSTRSWTVADPGLFWGGGAGSFSCPKNLMTFFVITLDAHICFKLNSSKPVSTTPTSIFMSP